MKQINGKTYYSNDMLGSWGEGVVLRVIDDQDDHYYNGAKVITLIDENEEETRNSGLVLVFVVSTRNQNIAVGPVKLNATAIVDKCY